MKSAIALLFLAAAIPSLSAWTPGTANPDAAQGFVVNTSDRTDVLAFFNTVYSASEDFPQSMNWTGNVSTGQAGTTSANFKEDVRRRINFYRALNGLPADISFNSSENAKCQAAALIFSANNAISHTPPTSWTYYTASAALAAEKSNLALGNYGPDAIDSYMLDEGSNNAIVGHRRWLLYSLSQEMATGDVPASSNKPAANAVWVIGNFKANAPKTFVAWPSKGFLPVNLLPARWSLSYPGANFGAAAVSMTRNGASIPVSIISRTDNGYGDNTLVWEPTGLLFSETRDTVYRVTVTNISGSGIPTSSTYTVTTFDPGILGQTVTISGNSDPNPAGEVYTFNSISQADRYELRASTGSSAPWSEGAENSASVLDGTASDYSLIQSEVKLSGSQAFHLTFPSFAAGDQSFEIKRDIVLSGSSQLVFRDLFRWATSGSRLSAEVSADAGATWQEVWGRNGNNSTSSSGWDGSFNTRSISLAGFAGKPVRVRFIYRYSGSTFLGTDSGTGVFLDDISVSAANELVNTVTTTLAANTTSFNLNSALGNVAPASGVSYFLRIRPNVGTRWFGDGAIKVVTRDGPATPNVSPLADPTSPQPAPSSLTREIFLAGNLTFGSRKVGSKVRRALVIVNNGNSALRIFGLRTPAGFAAAFTGTIPPGGRRRVILTFSPAKKKSYVGSILVRCNATGGNRSISVAGAGQ